MHNKNIEFIFLIFLMSAFCIPSSLGMYKSNTTSSKTVSTADWNVSLNQNEISDSISIVNNGSTGTYTLKVVSDSEVDTEYSIIISNIPTGVDVKLDTENNYRTPVNGVVTIEPAGTIHYTGSREEVTRIITFRANNGSSVVNNRAINIDVVFKQL